MKPVPHDWYETQSLGDGVTLITESHVAGWLRCNIWHVRGRDRDLLIDTGMGVRPLKVEVAALSERPITAIVTHSHFDHSGGLHEFEDRRGHAAEASVVAEPTPESTLSDGGFVRAESFRSPPHEGFEIEDYAVKPAPLTGHLDEGDLLDLGDRHFKVLHLPGHSPGSIGLYEAETQILFSGDAIYDGPLIDDIFHSDAEQYEETMRRLRELPVSVVHGGHSPSFGRETMVTIIDEYLAGGRRLGDSEAWVAAQIAAERDAGS